MQLYVQLSLNPAPHQQNPTGKWRAVAYVEENAASSAKSKKDEPGESSGEMVKQVHPKIFDTPQVQS